MPGEARRWAERCRPRGAETSENRRHIQTSRGESSAKAVQYIPSLKTSFSQLIGRGAAASRATLWARKTIQPSVHARTVSRKGDGRHRWSVATEVKRVHYIRRAGRRKLVGRNRTIRLRVLLLEQWPPVTDCSEAPWAPTLRNDFAGSAPSARSSSRRALGTTGPPNPISSA